VIVGAGFIVAVLAALASAAGGSSPRGRRSTICNAGLLGVVAMITATISGLSYLLALGGLTMIRGWNRISIVIAFFGVIGLALGLTIGADRLRARRGPQTDRRLLAIALVLIALIGWFDQTSPSDGRRASATAVAWNSDAAFFAGIAAALPAGSAVYQFPESPFPEGGSIGKTGLYDGARGYIHAPALKWSFGAVLGRFVERPPDLPTRTGTAIVDFLHDQGFRAVLIDRWGYEDLGVQLTDRLWSQDNPPVAQSNDGRYVWFDIGPPPG
jgi:phosphoglycerol transferase